jgi:hypothetical protein
MLQTGRLKSATVELMEGCLEDRLAGLNRIAPGLHTNQYACSPEKYQGKKPGGSPVSCLQYSSLFDDQTDSGYC